MPRQLLQLVAVLCVVAIGLTTFAVLLGPLGEGHERAERELSAASQIQVGDSEARVVAVLNANAIVYRIGTTPKGNQTLSFGGVRAGRTLEFEDGVVVKIRKPDVR